MGLFFIVPFSYMPLTDVFINLCIYFSSFVFVLWLVLHCGQIPICFC